jgi:nitrogen fixation NifU-like protein
MNELQELYQEVILDHSRAPRNKRRMDSFERTATGRNPLCGDVITIYLKLIGDRIEDVSFEGEGCAISTASASLMTDAVKGRKVAEALDVFERFHSLFEPGQQPELGKLDVFVGVRNFPSRVKCATLAWHALRAAIETPSSTVSTEEGNGG